MSMDQREMVATHVSEGKERTVKEEHDAKQHEERAERGQPNADFYTRHLARHAGRLSE